MTRFLATVERITLGRLQAQQGQALIEYALIISFVAIVAIASLQLAGVRLSSLFSKVAGDV